MMLAAFGVYLLLTLPSQPVAGDAPILYTVQPGDTLKGIATCLGQSDVDWRVIVSVIEDENPRAATSARRCHRKLKSHRNLPMKGV